MAETQTKLTCYVCGYEDPHFDEPLDGFSYQICACCGTEDGAYVYGPDDVENILQLRASWVLDGCPWWYRRQSPPSGWDPEQQLQKLLSK